MPATLSVVDSKPLPSLSVVSSQPLEQPGVLSRVGQFVSDTLSKTAQSMNVENQLAAIDEKHPTKEVIEEGLKNLGLAALNPMAPFLVPLAKDTYQKFKQKDYSGAASNLIQLGFAADAGTEGAGSGAVSDAVGDAAKSAADTTVTAGKGAVKGAIAANKGGLQNPAHAAAVATSTLVPVVGHKVAGVIEGANTLYGAAKGAKAALDARSAQQASDAAVEANRATGNNPGWQQAGTQPTNPPAAAPVAPISATQTPSGRSPGGIQNQPAPTPPAAPRVSLPQQAGIQGRTPTPAQPVEAIPATQTPSGRVPGGIQNQTAPEAPTAAAAAVDPNFLDDLARAQAGKPFAKLTPAQQAGIRSLASRVAESATSGDARPTPAPTRAATPAPPVAPTPAAVPESIPARAPAVPPDSAATGPQSQPTQAEAAAPSPSGTTPQRVEYYPETAPKHVPSPAEVGLGFYSDRMAEGGSIAKHIQTENEKGFNAADFAFQNGIRDPRVFDRLTQDQSKEFLNGVVEKDGTVTKPGALQHGREVGNPTPSKAYSTPLQNDSLRMAKAHLLKMVADQKAQAAAALPAETPAVSAQPIEAPAESGAQIEARQRFAQAKAGSLSSGGETGPNGPIFREFTGRPAEAIQKLQQAKTGEVPAVWNHPELGPIDLIWGNQKGGLAHIISKHVEGAKDLDLKDLAGMIPNMQVDPALSDARSASLVSPSHRAAVRLDFDGVRKRWLVSAFERRK